MEVVLEFGGRQEAGRILSSMILKTLDCLEKTVSRNVDVNNFATHGIPKHSRENIPF